MVEQFTVGMKPFGLFAAATGDDHAQQPFAIDQRQADDFRAGECGPELLIYDRQFIEAVLVPAVGQHTGQSGLADQTAAGFEAQGVAFAVRQVLMMAGDPGQFRPVVVREEKDRRRQTEQQLQVFTDQLQHVGEIVQPGSLPLHAFQQRDLAYLTGELNAYRLVVDTSARQRFLPSDVDAELASIGHRLRGRLRDQAIDDRLVEAKVVVLDQQLTAAVFEAIAQP